MNRVTSEKLKEIIEKIETGVDVNELKDEDPLREQGLDSLDMLNIFLNLEEMFDVKIPDEDVDRLVSINDIVDYIKK